VAKRRNYRGFATDTALHRRVTISDEEDTVLPAQPDAVYRSVQVVGTASSVLVCRGSSTLDDLGQANGDVLDPAPAAKRGGGFWDDERYTGPIALRALDAPVVVSICETGGEEQ
jgi:hypothetical protein